MNDKTLIVMRDYGCDGRSAGLDAGHFWIPNEIAVFSEYYTVDPKYDGAIRQYILDTYGEDVSWNLSMLKIEKVRDPEAKLDSWRDTIEELTALLDTENLADEIDSIRELKELDAELLREYHERSAKIKTRVEEIRRKRGTKIKEPDWYDPGNPDDRKLGW